MAAAAAEAAKARDDAAVAIDVVPSASMGGGGGAFDDMRIPKCSSAPETPETLGSGHMVQAMANVMQETSDFSSLDNAAAVNPSYTKDVEASVNS